MTTSLTKSTIPEYDPNSTYSSPRSAPRVRPEAVDNYLRNRGSLNIGDWAQQSHDWQSPRPAPKVKYDVAQQAYNRNRGCMSELLTGYWENPPVIRKGPRITKEAYGNFLKNKGSLTNLCYNNYGKNVESETHQPKVQYEGKSNLEKNQGSMGNLFRNYGYAPLSARPVPRVKFEGVNNMEANRGSSIDKTLKQVPPSSRPSSSQFFRTN